MQRVHRTPPSWSPSCSLPGRPPPLCGGLGVLSEAAPSPCGRRSMPPESPEAAASAWTGPSSPPPAPGSSAPPSHSHPGRTTHRPERLTLLPLRIPADLRGGTPGQVIGVPPRAARSTPRSPSGLLVMEAVSLVEQRPCHGRPITEWHGNTVQRHNRLAKSKTRQVQTLPLAHVDGLSIVSIVSLEDHSSSVSGGALNRLPDISMCARRRIAAKRASPSTVPRIIVSRISSRSLRLASISMSVSATIRAALA